MDFYFSKCDLKDSTCMNMAIKIFYLNHVVSQIIQQYRSGGFTIVKNKRSIIQIS